jgi:hypothetical protein
MWIYCCVGDIFNMTQVGALTNSSALDLRVVCLLYHYHLLI